MDAYSTILLVAMLAVGISALGLLAYFFSASTYPLLTYSIAGSLIGVVLAAVTLFYHFLADHALDGSGPGPIGKFLGLHPAPLVTIILGATIFLVALRSAKKSTAI